MAIMSQPNAPASRKGSNSVQVRRYNERVVLEALQRLGQASKAELARSANLTPQAVAVIVDHLGHVLERWGDTARPVYARSALKPIQAIPLVESGAAERFALSDAEVALACASHGGEPRHVEAVARWLDRIGLGVADLECGAHPPSYAPAAASLKTRNLRKACRNRARAA